MSFTNAQLAQQIANLIEYWTGFKEEHANWLGGTVGGGPGADGRYPLTDYTGNQSLIESPAKLADNVNGLVSSADAYAQAAAASAAAALASQNTATTQAGLADAARILAESARTQAQTAETGALDAQVTSVAQANLASDRAGYAQEWASAAHDTPVSVAAGGDGATTYSALHWATVAQGFAGSIDSNLYAQLAQNESVTGTWNFVAAPTIGGTAISLAGHTHSGDYLALTGGTLTGVLKVERAGAGGIHSMELAHMSAGDGDFSLDAWNGTGTTIDQESVAFGLGYQNSQVGVFSFQRGGGANALAINVKMNGVVTWAYGTSANHSALQLLPDADFGRTLGNASYRWSGIYGENFYASGPSSAMWFHPRNNDGGNYAWYAPDGTAARLYRSGSGDVFTVTSTGTAVAAEAFASDLIYQTVGRHRGVLNATLTEQAQGYSSGILGDGIQQDHIAFKARSNCEYLVGSTWTARTDTYDNVFDGRLGAGYGNTYVIPAGEDGVRFTWTNVGYVFVDNIIVMGSTAGNSIRITAECSANGTDWTLMRQSGWASSWPGAHVFNVQSNTSAGTSYYRITIERTHDNANNIEIGHIRSQGIYGGGQRLFEWNYNRKLTFANRIEIGGSGYEVNPTGTVVGQYTANSGYIQAPGGASGVVDIWSGATSTLARFGDSQINIYRHTYPNADNTLNLGTGSLRWAGVYAASLCSTYLWDGAGAKRAIDMYDTWLRLNEAGHFTSGTYTPYLLRADGGFKYGTNGVNTIDLGGGGGMRVSTASGNVEIGPQNTGFCHFTTDRAQFYFGSQTMFNGTVYDYNGGVYRPYLKLASPTGYTSGGNVTFSTSAPSGGSDGDIWFVYT